MHFPLCLNRPPTCHNPCSGKGVRDLQSYWQIPNMTAAFNPIIWISATSKGGIANDKTFGRQGSLSRGQMDPSKRPPHTTSFCVPIRRHLEGSTIWKDGFNRRRMSIIQRHWFAIRQSWLHVECQENFIFINTTLLIRQLFNVNFGRNFHRSNHWILGNVFGSVWFYLIDRNISLYEMLLFVCCFPQRVIFKWSH